MKHPMHGPCQDWHGAKSMAMDATIGHIAWLSAKLPIPDPKGAWHGM
jgi:hypothetical protein